MKRHYVYKEVGVDITDEVEELAEEIAGEWLSKPTTLPVGSLSADDAVLAVRRACAREGATCRVVLQTLLRQIRADSLTREVASLLGWKRGRL